MPNCICCNTSEVMGGAPRTPAVPGGGVDEPQWPAIGTATRTALAAARATYVNPLAQVIVLGGRNPADLTKFGWFCYVVRVKDGVNVCDGCRTECYRDTGEIMASATNAGRWFPVIVDQTAPFGGPLPVGAPPLPAGAPPEAVNIDAWFIAQPPVAPVGVPPHLCTRKGNRFFILDAENFQTGLCDLKTVNFIPGAGLAMEAGWEAGVRTALKATRGEPTGAKQKGAGTHYPAVQLANDGTAKTAPNLALGPGTTFQKLPLPKGGAGLSNSDFHVAACGRDSGRAHAWPLAFINDRGGVDVVWVVGETGPHP